MKRQFPCRVLHVFVCRIDIIMDSDSSGLVTIVLDHQVFADHERANQHSVALRLRTLVGRAERLIHRYHVGGPAFGADDAVQDALLKLPWQAVMDGKIHAVETEEALAKLIHHKQDQNHFAVYLGEPLSAVKHHVRLIKAILEPVDAVLLLEKSRNREPGRRDFWLLDIGDVKFRCDQVRRLMARTACLFAPCLGFPIRSPCR